MDSQGNTLIMRDLPISMPHCIPPAVTYISGARVCGTKLRTVQFCCLPWTVPGEAQGCSRWLIHPGLAGHQHTPDTHIHTQRSALMPWGRGTPQCRHQHLPPGSAPMSPVSLWGSSQWLQEALGKLGGSSRAKELSSRAELAGLAQQHGHCPPLHFRACGGTARRAPAPTSLLPQTPQYSLGSGQTQCLSSREGLAVVLGC